MQALFAALQLIPFIVQAVVSVEQMFGSKSGTGAQKKSVVMETVKSVVEKTDEVKAQADVLIPVVSQTIDGVVGALNASGLWPKGQEELARVHGFFGAFSSILGAFSAAGHAAQAAGSSSTFPSSAGD